MCFGCLYDSARTNTDFLDRARQIFHDSSRFLSPNTSPFFVIITLILGCFRVFMQTRKMTKKWPWAVTEDILLKKIGDLRAEFNIELL